MFVLVPAATRDETVARAIDVLRRERWELLEIQRCDRLLEDRVREEGGEFLRCYEEAQSRGSAIRAFPRNFAAGRSGIPAVRPPRVTQAFIDLVVADVGGERLPTDGEHRVADYRIGEWLFELKDLQEEGLLKLERQQKLATLFAPHVTPGAPFRIDPSVLSDADRRRFFDILSTPIQAQVKSASKQIRSTKALMAEDGLRGGIIYLNTGYGSLPPEEFGPLVERYVRKDTTQVEAIFCVSTFVVTNGFDSQIFFLSYPDAPSLPVVARLQEAFANRFEEAMTQVVRGQVPPSSELFTPLTPVAFNSSGSISLGSHR